MEEKIIPWIIATGNSSFYSWDKRISLLPPYSSIFFNKETWKFKIKERKITKKEQRDFSESEYKKLLRQSLDETFSEYYLDFNKWALSLSGGHDCRGILAFLSRNKTSTINLKTVTWGGINEEKLRGSDAHIAKKTANYYETQHHYYNLNHSNEKAKTVIERFLKNGEGRIDHLTGYLDGFEMWKNIFEDKIEGLIRGNILFSNISASSEYEIRNFMGLSLLSEFTNLKKYTYLQKLKHNLPEHIKLQNNENLSVYRDRLLLQYRIPIVQAALADLKFPYVEEFNPLLTNRLIDLTQMIPDNLRNNKTIFKEIVESIDPEKEYAHRSGTSSKKQFLKRKDFTTLVKEEFKVANAKNIFPKSFLEEILHDLKASENQKKSPFLFLKAYIIHFVRRLLPNYTKKKISKIVNKPKNLDIFTLAFRVTIICMMTRIIENDLKNKS
ncbi:hypothetical protein [Autumnicola edwardsiae]|uniref:Asparagine synthetase domain-containing protein n=1 Tax=Autumnicola edwardsiae TaxID=3075594 RepID=A0ABU3CTE8_9FLAO|nr:hypothetical protein [Zunongwangia sp. F297]MDT0649639.1 hypothetical protein [Zunongwangia sp. F297]